ncbi:MAG: LysM peptidoglycan-binding domain-containing protein [Brevinema sp.]
MKHFLLTLYSFFALSHLNATIYKVQKGDSLWEISNKFNTSMTTIRKINDLYGNHLEVGRSIFIPDKIETYIVKDGDTFESISEKFNTKIKYIVTLNNIADNHTYVGQTLKIPVAQNISKHEEIKASSEKPISYSPIVYRVKRGDTLSDVALKYKTTVPALRQLNNKRSSQIYIGERLVVGNRKIAISSQQNTNVLRPNMIKSSHIVARNQTIGGIALRYHVSINDIKKWNNKTSSTVYVGEKLILYTEKKDTPPASSYRTINYTVRKGDHLLLIAGKFGVRASDLKRWNKKTSDKLYVGERLFIRIPKKITEGNPRAKIDNTKLIRYKIKRGDTLDQIALRYKVSRSQLLSWNRKRNSNIYIGESLKIYIPSSTSVTVKKKSAKAQYNAQSRVTGIRSNRFEDVGLPIKASQILYTVSSGRGIDIKLKSEVPLTAPINAKVSYAGYINALKNVVILDLSNDRTIVYAGLDTLKVTKGQEIVKGQQIGFVGKYTNEENPILYMELRDKKKVANVFHTYKILAAKQNKK